MSVFSFELTYDDVLQKKVPDYGGSSWKTAPLIKTQNGFGLRTGEEFNATAIDIDDVTMPHNKQLYDILMDTCNLVAKTHKGFHFVFEYMPALKNSSSTDLKLDVRNDGGHLYVEPSTYKIAGETKEYKWIKTPTGSRLNALPRDAMTIMYEIGSEVYFKDEVLPNHDEAEEVQEKEPADVETIETVLQHLKQTRIDSYSSWVSIGMILKHEGLPFDVYDRASMRSKYYNKKECMLKWRSFRKNVGRQLTQATLWKWLKEDNPEVFKEHCIKRKDTDNLFDNLNHKDVASYFYNMKPDEYLYNENLGWYVLQKNSTWARSAKTTPGALKLHIANTLQSVLEEYTTMKQKDYINKKNSATDDDEKSKLKDKELEFLKHTKKIYKILGSSEFINGTISFLPAFYNIHNLENILDNARQLYAFNDCVVDLETGATRPIKPTDYITITTGYDYPKSIPTHKIALETFLQSLFENNETLDYFLLTLAFGIVGYNRFEEYYAWVGTGANGKGAMATLMEKAFGEYFKSVDPTMFTQRMVGKDKPNSVMIDMRNKRIMMTTEPESDEPLQTGFLKLITGGDNVSCRTLNSAHNISYQPQFSVYLQMNNPPRLSKIDQGIQRRVRVIVFPFQFKPAYEIINTLIHRLGDPDLKDKKCKSDEWRNEFMLMLLGVYLKNKDLKSLIMPSKVKESTKDYIDDNNKAGAWLATYYTMTHDPSDRIQAKELKAAYLMDNHIERIGDKSFKELLAFNNLTSIKEHSAVFYTGLVRKIIEE